MTHPYRILARKRAGRALTVGQISEVVQGAVDASWSDAQLAAFLMASAIRGLDPEETRALTLAMLESGEKWALSEEYPTLGDKHSTGGVGDKVSLILSPLLAACDQPVVMLTGRGLGHTGGTADKLESIEGVSLGLDRNRCLNLLRDLGMAIGVATGSVAPADRKLYALRDQTATVESLPLITGSILSKKLACGAAGLALDVKVGDGAFLPDLKSARALARLLVDTANELGTPTSALITDMNQPLGLWVGHCAEILETLDCLEGRGPADLMELVFALCQEVASLVGRRIERVELEAAIESGRAREIFGRWVRAQGGLSTSLEPERLPLAPSEVVLKSPLEGYVGAVATRQLGLLLAEAGGGRVREGQEIDVGVSLRYSTRLGRKVESGEELARVYLRQEDDELAERFRACFSITPDRPETASGPVVERITSRSGSGSG